MLHAPYELFTSTSLSGDVRIFSHPHMHSGTTTCMCISWVFQLIMFFCGYLARCYFHLLVRVGQWISNMDLFLPG